MQRRTTATPISGFVVRSIFSALTLLALVFATSPLAAQAESAELDEEMVENGEEEEAEEEEDESQPEEDIEEMTVTGTRLPDGDPTASVSVYTAEDIALSGASTVDEFFRTLPQQFSSTNPTSSALENTGDHLIGRETGSQNLANRTDLSTVNLNGLGSGNTLILLNGRRIASYGGSERDIVNILGIPMAAIERVEVQLDGGSAVYGADAIGGVVNFITKQGYRGLTADFTQQHSGAGSHLMMGSLTFGGTWELFGGLGDGTLTVSKKEQEPILNGKLGYSSRDLRDTMGPEFDYRYYTAGQPGIVHYWNESTLEPDIYRDNRHIDGSWTRDPDKLVSWQLPSDHSGLNATIDDFNMGRAGARDHIVPYDNVSHENGAHTSQVGLNFHLNHDPIEGVKVSLHGRYSKNETYRKRGLEEEEVFILVPASNAFNPFPHPVVVGYVARLEQENGLIATPFQQGTNTNQDFNLVVEWDFSADHSVNFDYTDTKSDTSQIFFGIPKLRERSAPGTEEYYRRLASSDPNEALNFFGNGTHQGSNIGNVLSQGRTRIGHNSINQYGVTLKGYLWQFRGENIAYVVGTQWQSTRYKQREAIALDAFNGRLTTADNDLTLLWNGTAEPVIRNQKFLFELSVPIFSEAQAGWWGRSLKLTFQNTRSIDSQWGATGGGINEDERTVDVEVWDPVTTDWITVQANAETWSRADDLELTQYKKSDDAPRMGLIYYPFDDLEVTFNFSRSIDPPLISQLYDTSTAQDEPQWEPIHDPYDPDGPTEVSDFYLRRSDANPDLRAAVSENSSIQVTWYPSFINGLSLHASYLNHNFEGDIGYTDELRDYPEALSFPEYAIRNERGDLLGVRYDYYSRKLKKVSSLDLNITYFFSTYALGQFDVKAIHHRILDDYEELLPGIVVDTTGTINKPDRYTSQLQLFWSKNKFSASLFARYIPPYLNDTAHQCEFDQIRSQTGRCAQFELWSMESRFLELRVASLTVVDGTFSYRYNDNLNIRVGALNLFDRGPPLTVRNNRFELFPYDPVRWNARGRVLSIGVQYTMEAGMY